MSKRQILILIGIWIIVLPFLGFPGNWQRILFVITGVYLLALSYSLRLEGAQTNSDEISFVDHKNEAPIKPVVENNTPAMDIMSPDDTQDTSKNITETIVNVNSSDSINKSSV